MKDILSKEELLERGFWQDKIFDNLFHDNDGNTYNLKTNNFINKQYKDTETGIYYSLASLRNGTAIKDLEGFVEIPGFSKYMINKEGVMYSKVYKKRLSPFNTSGYYSIMLKDDNGVERNRRVHHLVIMTYKHEDYLKMKESHEKYNPSDEGYLVVNHIDGNKLNNSLDNLEVISQKENYKHAIDTGLKLTKPVVIKWIDTGEEKEFISMQSASLALGLNHKTLSQRFTSKDYLRTVYPEGIQIRFLSDPDFEKPIYYINNGSLSVGIVAIDYKVSPFHEKTYRSLNAYCEEMGFHVSAITSIGGIDKQPILNNLHRIKKQDDFSEWKTCYRNDPILELVTSRKVITLVFVKENEKPIVFLPNTTNKDIKDLQEFEGYLINNLIKWSKEPGYLLSNGYRAYRYKDFVESEDYNKWKGRYTEYRYFGG
nr:MAG TPA: homing endonuclease [Caudoviricetes sp.]